jgi:hypothetical protein
VLVDSLGLLEMPTLVVWGERDRVFPRFQAKRAAARLREGSLVLIPNCGHMSLWPHAPRRVPRPLLGGPRRVPPRAGAPLIDGDEKNPEGTLECSSLVGGEREYIKRCVSRGGARGTMRVLALEPLDAKELP